MYITLFFPVQPGERLLCLGHLPEKFFGGWRSKGICRKEVRSLQVVQKPAVQRFERIIGVRLDRSTTVIESLNHWGQTRSIYNRYCSSCEMTEIVGE